MDAPSLIASHRLLDHPFYRRWEAGEVSRDELAAYAAQYRYFEAELPSFLKALASVTSDTSARALLEANLDDEVGGPVTHLALFDRFASELDAPVAAPSPAMSSLLDLYRGAANDASFGLGVLAGYEVQASEVATTKGQGLRQHYGFDERAASFWTLHGEVEVDHAAWTLEAAAGADQERVAEGVQRSAAAWWAFLDEREALRAA